MKAIRKGDKGALVKEWQYFLVGLGYSKVVADGEFGPKTHDATVDFQKSHGLIADGIVGNSTYGKAMQFGYMLVKDKKDDSKTGPNWPAPPKLKPLTASQMQSQFGPIEFKIQSDKSSIKITNNFQAKKMTTIEIPQIKSLPPYFTSKLNVHKAAAPQFLKLFSEWEKAGLLNRVLTYDGSFNPRLIRGSSTTLSTHAFGIAIDINVQWNGLGVNPALVGQKGSVRELVPIANKLGFYWGGHFGRRDGMHFEIAKII
jgi:peptidoglycan hydrolase-like protein with peptidoglycan-binding domain